MKRSVKLIAIALTLVMLMAALPLTAMAEVNDGSQSPGTPVPAKTNVTITAKCFNAKQTTLKGTYSTKVLEAESVTVDSSTFGRYIYFNGSMYEFYSVNYNAQNSGSVVLADGKTHNVAVIYVPHTHSYAPRHDRIYHWDGCRCGKKLNVEHHVDPATDEDSICTCGYQFSSNADLVTLWLSNMVLEPRFDRDITEYNAAVYTYKPVTSTTVKVRTFDALATVEKPTDLSIEDGMNVFKVTVTAEDRKTTKTYTVYAYLPVTVDGMEISSGRSEGAAMTIAAPKAVCKKRIASVTVTEAIAKTMADQAKQNESTQVVLQPTFSKWANDTLVVTVPAAGLKAIAESKADFVIKTWQGDVIVPNSELASIAGQGESIALSVVFKDGPLKCTVAADGKDVDSSKITVK